VVVQAECVLAARGEVGVRAGRVRALVGWGGFLMVLPMFEMYTRVNVSVNGFE
jgi:hypothetical protein